MGPVMFQSWPHPLLLLCVSAGYDFTVYSQLSSVITKLFFPPTNPEIAQISFWAVYAVGFVARPIGAVIFGHVGALRSAT